MRPRLLQERKGLIFNSAVQKVIHVCMLYKSFIFVFLCKTRGCYESILFRTSSAAGAHQDHCKLLHNLLLKRVSHANVKEEEVMPNSEILGCHSSAIIFCKRFFLMSHLSFLNFHEDQKVKQDISKPR